MQENNYTFDTYNDYTKIKISDALSRINKQAKPPIILCIGSDLVLGDSLGPLIGTLLVKSSLPAFVYGTLSFPITAKEVNYAKEYLKNLHPDSMIIAVDAAVGDIEDIGLIKVKEKGLKPGLGVNKNLKVIGDCSIIGIVAEKCKDCYKLLNITRLNLVYKMAEQISNGIIEYVNSLSPLYR